MEIFRYPKREQWEEIVKRPALDVDMLNDTVADILAAVKNGGDEAVKAFERRFDKASIESLVVTPEEKDEAERLVSYEMKEALQLAHRNIYAFHEAQRFTPIREETAEGVFCWQKSVPIESVGLYVPGGTAPLFSTVLMLATPAKIAGCRNIVMCTPPNAKGEINPVILVAARIAGVSHIIKAGGAQAIGAMAYGTASVPKVYKIFGPGNRYVMAAKQLVSLHDVAIDMPAGPSEVCIIADDDANSVFIAADLLSQAEHGIDSQVMLLTTSEKILDEVKEEITRQLAPLPRREIAEKALAGSRMILVADEQEAIELSNAYAPEHLMLQVNDYERLAEKVVNAGSVFLGRYASESAGDYASGTNHTLPTHGYAVACNGVNLDSYCRKITFQMISEEGISSIGRAVEIMAEGEQLLGHKNAMTLRLKEIMKR